MNSREFQVFAKPAGSVCNLGCDYCYYSDKLAIAGSYPVQKMSDQVLELFIRQNIEASNGKFINFSWHGGEPLLAGIEFYRKAVSFQKKYCPAGKSIINGIQTNGTLIDEAWCRFLAEQHFKVGISMDGPEVFHNQFRKGKDGKGTLKKVLHGYDLLVMHGLDPEILCVVNAINVASPLEVYHFLRQLGAPFITFIPLVEPAGGGSSVSERSVKPEDYGRFLVEIFDEWVARDIGRIKVQIFEEALRTAFGQEHTLCVFKPVCGGVPVVEHNGDFFTCDHYVSQGNNLGNISEISLRDLLDHENQKAFGRAKSDMLPDYCKKCDVLDMCNGECPKNRIITSPDGEPGLNYLCEGYRKFFRHCGPLIKSVAFAWRNPEKRFS